MTYAHTTLIIAIIALAVSVFTLIRAPSGTPALSLAEFGTTFEPDEAGDRVREYLLAHPDVVMEVLETTRLWREDQQEKEQYAQIEEQRDLIYNDPQSYVAGNPDGDVTIVEFFDYRCGFCKSTFGDLMETVARDGNIRLVLKEFPILGPQSIRAAEAAVASLEQDGYLPNQNPLMQARGNLEDPQIFDLAAKSGLDIVRLQEDMKKPIINATIENNLALGEALGVNGTPSFIINDQSVSGAVSKEKLQELVDEAREAA